jgi:uncharacterized protein YbjT (DUF2867 family)
MSVLITGPTGNIGGEVVKQCVARRAAVRALVRSRDATARALPPEAEPFVGDFTDRGAVRAALEGMERLFLLGPMHERMEEHLIGAIEAAREAGVRHVVQLSAIGAHAGSSGFFSRVHGRAEQALIGSGLAYTILQPSFFQQNLLWSAGTVRAQGAIFNAAGDGEAGHVAAHDVAAVATEALTAPIERHAGEIYIVTGPERLTYAGIARWLSAAIGRAVEHRSLPPEAQCSAMIRQGGMPPWQARAVVDLDVRCARGELSAVTDAVQRVTGRAPTSVESFVRENAAAFA